MVKLYSPSLALGSLAMLRGLLVSQPSNAAPIVVEGPGGFEKEGLKLTRGVPKINTHVNELNVQRTVCEPCGGKFVYIWLFALSTIFHERTMEDINAHMESLVSFAGKKRHGKFREGGGCPSIAIILQHPGDSSAGHPGIHPPLPLESSLSILHDDQPGLFGARQAPFLLRTHDAGALLPSVLKIGSDRPVQPVQSGTLLSPHDRFANRSGSENMLLPVSARRAQHLRDAYRQALVQLHLPRLRCLSYHLHGVLAVLWGLVPQCGTAAPITGNGPVSALKKKA
ncbi:hypothetical protein F3Y22_tig00112864pilonHSYRG00143 [Hibiscus syriacus]|uniref:Secreted protein n=1 Tax=Hibiscus syriacus TaxID=106335 RepID=A0A6A2Y294_HIBSY|nr:hypothetical protein F3Y22_tig00112864pilonHSYRG00143 [Hibiscus syriacus]